MQDVLGHPASYRDPDGFIFYRNGRLYRQINKSYQPHFERLMETRLYHRLTDEGLLVRHQEVDVPAADPRIAWKVIAPEPLSFISYPYGWSFSALKKAALLTLDVQKKALDAGLWLKDASAYNIQFQGIRPVFIDTLSFTLYPEGEPWPAYRQFCEHFLAPLSLMVKRDLRLSSLLVLYGDGIPLDLAAKLLPYRSLFSFRLLLHLFLHARLQQHGGLSERPRKNTLPRSRLMHVLESLRSVVNGLNLRMTESGWQAYYKRNYYSDAAFAHKQETVESFLRECGPGRVIDVGANTGLFSRLAARLGNSVVAIDADPYCSEANFRLCEKENISGVLPLTIDILNPMPATGFENVEHASFTDRMSCDTLMCLALLHHLRLHGNLPFDRFASLASLSCRNLIVEFVPLEDPAAVRLLHGRPAQFFPDYSQEGMEAAFQDQFVLRARVPLRDSGRVLYFYRKRS